MGKHKKIMCKVCYKEMRSDHLTRHLKQHSEKDTNNPATNIYGTNNYNTTSDVLADKEDEVESKAQTTIDEKALERSALKMNKKYDAISSASILRGMKQIESSRQRYK